MILKKLKYLILAVSAFCMATLSACSQQEDLPDAMVEGESQISLQIASLTTRSSGPSTDSKEKIKSLRIIMISDGFIEYNSIVNFEAGKEMPSYNDPNVEEKDYDYNADDFVYTLKRSTVAGNKKFYLIANEGSVNNVKFELEEGEILPEGLNEGMTLSSFLNHYTYEKLPPQGTLGYDNSGNGREFEKLLNAAYFEPDYTPSKDGNIYLLYTSYYDGITAENNPEVTIWKTMYLVPAATKFTFKFYNYRRKEAEVMSVSISKLNDQNFVMPKLDPSEKTKKLNGDETYWIDWLEEVGKKTQSDTTYNNMGWITRYYVPQSSKLDSVVFEKGEADWSIARLEDKNNAPSKTLGPYYLPESKYDNNYSITSIRVGAREVGDEEISYNEEPMMIDNLVSLFRATHVMVEVDMYESMVEIYCEIVPWTLVRFQGYVQEEEDD